MNLLKKCISAAEVCLLSFVRFLRSKKFAKLRKRIVCALCAISILPAGLSVSAALSGALAALQDDTVMTRQSIEVHPDVNDSQKTILLEGMMPEGATAKAVDVLNTTYEETDQEEKLPPATDQEPEKKNSTTKNSLKTKRSMQSANNLLGTEKSVDAEDNAATEPVTDDTETTEEVTDSTEAVTEEATEPVTDDTETTEEVTDSTEAVTEEATEPVTEAEEAATEPIQEEAEEEEPATIKRIPGNVLVAFDISILFGDSKFQPVKDHPIHVKIYDPAIPAEGELQLWHIKDNGSCEQIKDFMSEEGKVSFYATGFSVYEIVEIPAEVSYENATTKAELTSPKGQSSGFILYYNNPPKYLTSTVESTNGVLVETTKANEAAVWFFEENGTYLNLYTYVNDVKKYLYNTSGNSIGLSDTQADLLAIKPTDSGEAFYIRKNTEYKWLQHSNGGKGIRYYMNNENAVNCNIFIQYAEPTTAEDVIENLSGSAYGLFHYTRGSTSGNALMAEGDNHSLIKMVLTAGGKNRELYVDEDNEISQWSFEYDSNSDTFTLSTHTSDGTGYLCVDANGISTTTDPTAASQFTVIAGENNTVRLKANGHYLTFVPRAEEQGGGYFTVTTNPDSYTWLSLLTRAELDESDQITFSADRVSVSDIQNGQEVIVYMRLWNERDLRYDMYAVDRNGGLYPCYANGGKIMWLGDQTESLKWTFTEYYDVVTKEPNFYYELYNAYSEKYLAPQMTGDQVLSDDPIGINMPGRRNGDFYSEIIAWDNTRYAYIGLRPNDEKTFLEPCSESTSLPFYFATMEPLNLSDRLHEVPTVDNNDYGIKMKMVNFGTTPGTTYGNATASEITNTYFGGGGIDKLTPGLLSSTLKDNGYPDATPSNLDFAGAYANAFDVNHLFLQRVYESSGYFEFDSSQNFATLKKMDQYGNVEKDGNGKEVLNTDENGVTNFTLFHELGTHDKRTAYSLKHGQFFPFDTIAPGDYTSTNGKNLYSSLTSPTDGTIGELPESDPRKYEKLHKIHSEEAYADFYFGMELEASFIQTPSGLDAWGHDIVFEFTGDDDFWLYVDGDLVLDLGGTHSAVMGTINFRTGDVYYDRPGTSVHGEMRHTTLRQIFKDNYKKKNPGASNAQVEEYLNSVFAEDNPNIFKDYSSHTMKVFYMERGANASNLHMRFNIASVTPGHVVISKTVSGEGADELDTDFIEYPFQIFYTLPDGDDETDWIPLTNEDQFIGVTYQNSNQPATFIKRYRPPGFTEEQAYDNIYFINPSRNAEIAFPDDTIKYKIVECAVDSDVYETVTINGEPVPEGRVIKEGNLRSYESESLTALERPTISFDNFVKDNVIKDLYITKKLYDANDNEITDDPATFNFRLSISSVRVSADQIPLANMYHYYVLSGNKKICRFDSQLKTFVETEITYNHENTNKLINGEIEEYSIDEVRFRTSGFGAISGIPAGYTICVPGLPVGSIFKVTEDTKIGYGLAGDGYYRVMGDKILEGGEIQEIPSYIEYDGNPLNVGQVIAAENPQMEVHNKRGFGLAVKKNWSDVALTTGHETIYTAVYVDGEMLEGSVKQIRSPSTTANYFWTSLKPHTDGTERTDLDDYIVKEVKISNQDPTVASDGTVTNHGTVTPIENGGVINLTATRTNDATPPGETNDKNFDYFVSVDKGDEDASTRTDVINNIRSGGIAIRKFKWESETPLKNASFTLKDNTGNVIGTYTSGSDGIVTMMYEFERNQLYTLTETLSPRGYVGLQKPLTFKVNNDDSVSLYQADGSTPWNSATDLKWANSKPGTNGITAFIDVYNKPFNFKVAKMDSEDTGISLDNAHFALYKQTNTTIGGLEKNKDPLTGFEDMVTENGEVYICGGDSGRTVNPGANGSVYFLTETQAPLTYTKLEDDIVFRISPLGVPSLISDSYNGQLVETEDSYIYTLSVPNVKEEEDVKLLTIRKIVNGTAGDHTKEFTFTLTVDSDDPTDGYDWMKNGVSQNTGLHSGDTFTMKHDDEVIIAVPPDVDLTVTEQNQEYSASFTLNDGQPQRTNTMTFSITDDATLKVVNTLGIIVPTGIAFGFSPAFPCDSDNSRIYNVAKKRLIGA